MFTLSRLLSGATLIVLFSAAACDKEDNASACISQSLKEANRDRFCTLQYDPVCGCDGKTYGNACLAAAEGVTRTTPGECE